ncbi:hypothetical protein GJA_672 [Janthinobacterium agaricidamnosum NBRC 102515 = DSM 9628]|uniref:ADP ribosyltransferase domain-containing protein n=2 Tax=Janthinobacterium agaricidamnosum TaxID=55508 RepID=W0V0D4_9BURK|nr:hypothetical protein GJA_672 [Janthinobacterium agaricidamnosum NBRC 102515 = DSM 9628]
MGADAAPESAVFQHKGKARFASKFVSNPNIAGSLNDVLKGSNPEVKKAVSQNILSGFAADVLLKNWDVVGLEFDNILVTKDKKAIRIDNGSAFLSRAMGERKSPASLSELDEIQGLFKPSVNASYAKIAAHAGCASIQDIPNFPQQVKSIVDLRNSGGTDSWRPLVTAWTPGMARRDQDAIINMLDVRTEKLKQLVASPSTQSTGISAKDMKKASGDLDDGIKLKTVIDEYLGPKPKKEDMQKIMQVYNGMVQKIIQHPEVANSDVFKLIWNNPNLLKEGDFEEINPHDTNPHDINSLFKVTDNLKESSDGEFDNCNKGEMVSTLLYTTGLSNKINTALSKNDVPTLNKLSPILNGVSSMIGKGPGYSGKTYRVKEHDGAVLQGFYNAYKNNTAINVPCFLSTTKDKGLARRWEKNKPNESDFTGNTCFHITVPAQVHANGNKARDITKLGEEEEEQEVLFNHHTNFVVTDFKNIGDNKIGNKYLISLTAV